MGFWLRDRFLHDGRYRQSQIDNGFVLSYLGLLDVVAERQLQITTSQGRLTFDRRANDTRRRLRAALPQVPDLVLTFW